MGAQKPPKRSGADAGSDLAQLLAGGEAEENAAIARRLDVAAGLLEAQGADGFRVRAYHRAADTIRGLDRPLREIHRLEGRQGLTALPAIGDSIAGAIVEMLDTGRWAQLERLSGESRPEALFRTLPGVGPALASAIHDYLHVDTLEALEVAAHDGRLEGVPGVGPRRAEALRDALAVRLQRLRPGRRRGSGEEPTVAELLAVDRDYRLGAAKDTLPRISPKRFNPTGDAWLPIMHVDRDGWSYTALFSNTALAHRLGRTNDWVVIFFSRDGGAEGQRTVVTETRGPMARRRVVRGRERECLELAERQGG